MAQFGKASSKRGKPTYAYAIIGVSLVLFLFGIVGLVLFKSSQNRRFCQGKHTGACLA
jgi:cell division transport system permease protein